MEIIGKSFTVEQFAAYVAGLDLSAWKPELITVHHTAEPSLKMRPNGIESKHIPNLRDYYEGLGWNSGPHLFIDDRQIWVFSPMTRRGTHAISFNRNSWGVEMLGDYDSEDPKSGRGAAVLRLAALAIRTMLVKLGKDTSAIRFHRDDPKTKKTCPGKKISKEWFTNYVRTL